MKRSHPTTHILTELERLIALCTGETLTVEQLFSSLATQSQASLTFLLSLPFLLPIPLPGLSIPFGIVIAWIAFRMFLGKSVWFPRFLRDRPLSCKQLRNVFQRAEPLAQILSKWVKPRGTLFVKISGIKRLSFFLIFLCGVLLALPLPPGTNSPPAFTAAVLSLGVLEEDSVFIVLGTLCFFLLFLLLLTLIFWGYPQIMQWFGY